MRLSTIPSIPMMPSLLWRGASGSGPSLPTIAVTGGAITPFNRDGVDYIEVLFAQSGSYSVSGDVETHNLALAAGGANGGRVGSTYAVAGGGAGGLIEMLSAPLLAGTYDVSIGAGAPPNSVTGGGANGSNSTLSGPVSHTAIGGGYGAGSGISANGAPGGSGGGGRGTNDTNFNPGAGTPGQGFSGGPGYQSDTPSERAGGGGGGAGGVGGAGTLGVAGTGGLGRLLDWIATPRTVCEGGNGTVLSQTGDSPNETWGSGARGSINGTAGSGGDGFLFLRVHADQVIVELAA